MITTSYSNARKNLAEYLDRAVDEREPVVIQRRGHEDVVLISADELTSLLETAHLLRSPKNAERLLTALDRARAKTLTPQTVGALKAEVGFDNADA